MHYKYLNVMDEECEYLKNYLTHETKFLDYIKTNEEKQQARMNSIMNTFDNLDKALGKFRCLSYRSHIKIPSERFLLVRFWGAFQN